MRWPTDPIELHLGPNGIVIDDREAVPAPLAITGLAAALKGIRLPPGQRVRVSVDDTWCRSLLLDLPPELSGSKEIAGLVTHRLRDIFGAESTTSPRSLAPRKANPWRFPVWSRRSDPLLVSTLPLPVYNAILDWRKAARLRLVSLGSAWGNALAAVPAGRQGALAVFRGNRMTVGAWSARRWTGWRSFIASDIQSAEAELTDWLDGLHGTEGPAMLWYSGWRLQHAPARRWTARSLPNSGKPERTAPFDFRAGIPTREHWPLRRRLIAAAAVATLLAAILVSLPDDDIADASAIVAAIPREADAPRNPPAEQEPVAAEAQAAAPEATEVTIWPVILGTFEQRGIRWVLFSSQQNSSSVRRGGLIDGRFRIDRATANGVTLTDIRTMERQEIPLGNTRVQP